MSEFVSAGRLSYLIGLIYDCAVDPTQWTCAMEAIRTELDFENATLDLILLQSGYALTNVTCNIPTDYLALMEGAGPAVIEQWGGEEIVRTLPLDVPAVLTQVNPNFDAETSTNSYFEAFAKPQGIIDVLAIGLARDKRAIGTVSFGRHVSAGPIGRREIAVAHLLVPHLQRAATINRMLEGVVLDHAAFATALDSLTVPVALVDAALRLRHVNPAAGRLIDRGSLLKNEDGRLRAATAVACRALAEAVEQSDRDEGAIGRRGLGIPVSAADGSVGALHVLPLCQGRRRNDYGVVAAVFVAQSDSPFVAPSEMAAALFNLTPTEARVFDHLVTGHSQATTAAALGIARSTVKTHLTRLYDKIGVRSQVGLVGVATSLAVPIHGP